MRLRLTAFAAVLSIALRAGAAEAQDWQEYAYPDAGFAASFPAKPQVADAQYKAGGIAAPARVYSARLGSADYSVTVADMSANPASGTVAIEAAVRTLAALGEVKTDVRERIDRQFGREVSVKAADGGQITTAVFYVDKKLYVLAGRTEADASGLAVRFQQSLQFIGADGRPPRRPEDGPGFGGRGLGPPPGQAGEDHGGVAGEEGPGRRGPPPRAFADCRGKAEGAAVQHQTPRGDVVAATCVRTPEGLAARPARPPPGAPEDPPQG